MSDDAGHAIEEGSTNVYADLGYPDAAAMLRKAQIVGVGSHDQNAPLDPGGSGDGATNRQIRDVSHHTWTVSRCQRSAAA